MDEMKHSADESDDVVSRLNAMLERIAEASENQLRLLDERILELHDRGEVATDRLIKRIEEGVRAQIESLREEIEQLRRRVGEIRGGPRRKRASKPKTVAKKKAAKKTDRKVPKKAAKKKATKAVAKKQAKKPAKKR